MTREMHMGDIVRHFKRETVENPTTEYLYKDSGLCRAYGNRRKAGGVSGAVCSVQDLRPTLRYVYERGGPRKISCD